MQTFAALCNARTHPKPCSFPPHCDDSPAGLKPDPMEQAAPSEAAVIALVDDDRNILTSVSIALQAEGFRTRVYTDGEAALKALSETPADLGVFDIKMPRMNGHQLLERLRETSAMPVIFLTSKDDESDEELGLSLGADDYIGKPFSQRLLIARIRAILRRQEIISQPHSNDGEDTSTNIVRGRLAAGCNRHASRRWR